MLNFIKVKINFVIIAVLLFQNSDGLIMRRWVSLQINNGKFGDLY